MTDNNGNLRKQEILIPGQADNRVQEYGNDNLNRPGAPACSWHTANTESSAASATATGAIEEANRSGSNEGS